MKNPNSQQELDNISTQKNLPDENDILDGFSYFERYDKLNANSYTTDTADESIDLIKRR